MVLYSLNYKRYTPFHFLIAILLTVIIGAMAFIYDTNYIFKKSIIYLLLILTIWFFAWLINVHLKRSRVELLFNDEALIFNTLKNGQYIDITVPFSKISKYSILYSNTRACSVEFVMDNKQAHYFNFHDKTVQKGQAPISEAVGQILKSINKYNATIEDKIERNYGFFATKKGLYTIIGGSLIGLFMCIFILKGAKGLLTVPLFLFFLSMAISQRQKELNDGKDNLV